MKRSRKWIVCENLLGSVNRDISQSNIPLRQIEEAKNGKREIMLAFIHSSFRAFGIYNFELWNYILMENVVFQEMKLYTGTSIGFKYVNAVAWREYRQW